MADAGNHVIRKIVQSDWDGDMIADVEETHSDFLTVGVDDSRIDSDGDGSSDALEFLSGTDPFGFDPRLALHLSIDNGAVHLGWDSAEELRYLIERSDNLVDWEADGLPVDGANGHQNVSKPLGTRGFYRLAPVVPAPFSD